MTIALEKLSESDRIRIAESLFEVRTRSEGRGELMGLCPIHGESNPSFQYNYIKDTYYCFACGVKGDLPSLYMEVTKNTFGAFCKLYGIDGRSVDRTHKLSDLRPMRAGKPQSTPRKPPDAAETSSVSDLEAWHERALKLVEYAEKALAENSRILKWLGKRGITKKAAAAYRLGWIAEDQWRPRQAWGLVPEVKRDGSEKRLWIPAGMVVPLIDAAPGVPGTIQRLRIRRFTGTEPKYYVLPGPAASCMVLGLPHRAAVVVENWLDAIMLKSRVGELCAVIGTGSATARPGAETVRQLGQCARILVALDFGDEKAAGTKGWIWWRDAFPAAARRWVFTVGKDAGEAFKAGVDMVEWVKAGLPDGWFLGPYPIGLVTGKKEECELALVPESHEASETKTAAPGVIELAGLLRAHPVQIRVAPDSAHIWIRESQDWKRRNWETSKRISELVFRDRAVLEHIMRHGAEVIDGKNI